MPKPATKPRKPSTTQRRALPPSRRRAATGRQADVDLDAAEEDVITRAVQAGLAAAFKRDDDDDDVHRDGRRRAPSVHLESRRNTREYSEDQLEQELGPEHRDLQEEARARARGSRPESGSSSLTRAVDFQGRPTQRTREPGMLVAEWMGWMATAKGDPERAARHAKRGGAPTSMVRALQESSYSTGGAFVPLNISNDYIELLYNASVFLQAGPRRITVQNGNLVLPKLTGGATAYWYGEGQYITPSQQTTGQVRIDLKQVGFLVPASNLFLRDSAIDAIRMIKEDLSAKAAETIDSVAIRGLGSPWQPRGLRGWVQSANSLTHAGTSVANITTEIARGQRTLVDLKHRLDNLAWFMSPRTWFGLMAARDGNNNLVWAADLEKGLLGGRKAFMTQNIPDNVGTGGNKSEMYLADMNQIIYAQAPEGQRVDVADGPAYWDGSSVIAGFSRDESAVRLIERLDIVPRFAGTEIVQFVDVAIA